ncbi:MAG: amidohydrolase family protein [Ferruginibacter sp.]
MIIDSHVHFWKYDKVKDAWITDDMKQLQQDLLPQDIEPVLKNNTVNGIVAVQADQSEKETIFLKELADENDFIKGIVGWIGLQEKSIEERLHYFSQYSIIKGWRHIAQAEPAGFLLNENFLRGIAALEKYNYTYDILIYPAQIKDTLELVNKFPDQRMVLDHCAKPGIKNKAFVEWNRQIQELAKNPAVYCKLSGLLTEATWKQWDDATFYPYFDTVFDAFGTSRLLYGSDWPVMLLSGGYEQWKNLLENYIEKNCEAGAKEKIFGSNAIQFYNL